MVSDTRSARGGEGTGWFLTGLTGLRDDGRNAKERRACGAERGDRKIVKAISINPSSGCGGASVVVECCQAQKERGDDMGSLIGASVSCLWQAAMVVADVIAYGVGVAGSVGA